MVSLELSEFESATVAPGTFSAADLTVLQRHHNRHLSVQPVAGGYRIEAGSWVGTMQLPGGTIRVRPKVPVANLLTLLLYGHELATLRAVTEAAPLPDAAE